MKRTPFKRRASELKRTSTMRRSPMKRGRPGVQPPERRDDAFKAFVRTLPCCAPGEPCRVRNVDPNHKHGDGKGIKTHDRTCIPLCRVHHNQYEDKSGRFKDWTKQQTRDWHDRQSGFVLAQYALRVARVASAAIATATEGEAF